MNWSNFPLFAFISVVLWILGTGMISFSKKSKGIKLTGDSLVIIGTGVLAAFITLLWINLERPPMRTLGETRLWYSLFLPIIGYITYKRWGYKWFLSYSIILAGVFLFINYMHPENYSKTLMPALQSPWFVPHVIVYIFAYALLAASTLVALKGLYQVYYSKFNKSILNLADNLVYIGFSFLTFGLLFGALWAKEAWGHYWTWDPKETWAFLTWMMYLVYIHYRYRHKTLIKSPLWILSLAFAVLLIAWFGVNYLPTANESVHTYSN
jgi:ABC-type transport system involved in cytochrome c biogenesis permease subunit